MKVRLAVTTRIVNLVALLLGLLMALLLGVRMGLKTDLNLTNRMVMKARKTILMCPKKTIRTGATTTNLVPTMRNLKAVVTMVILVLTMKIASNSTLVQKILERKSEKNQQS